MSEMPSNQRTLSRYDPDQVREAYDIVQIVGEHVKLHRAIAQRVQIEQVFEHVANVAALPNPPDDSENLGYTGSQCNVCGFRRDRPFEDFAICPACGAQFNYDDNLAYREDWINRGCPWFGRRSRNGGKYWRDGHDEI